MAGRLAELQTFVRIVEAGSITAAAEQLDIAKSAVSRRLSELEQRLGVQLLNRTTRSIAITESGRSLYERSLRILEDIEEAELSVSRRHCELAGRLRIAAPLSFGVRHLAPAVDAFAHHHPAVEFDLDLNDRRVDLLDEGFDLAIRIADLEDSSLIARRIAVTTHVVCASPAYLERHGRPEHPDDLKQHRCLVYGNAPAPGTWRYRIGETWKKVQVPVALRATSGDFLAELASAGQGIVLEPDFIVYRELEQGRLVPLLRRYTWPSLGIYALYPPTRFLSRRVRDFIDFLSQRFANAQAWRSSRTAEGPGASPSTDAESSV